MKFLFMVSVGLISMTVNAKTVVVLGDSISAGYGIDVNAGWVPLLEKKIPWGFLEEGSFCLKRF
ncbi:MAG: hypothetical protein RLZZ384_867, partial [Pseudomonadota bacterium]